MKERGIIFSEPMVRALLAGTKTQTRRIIKSVAGFGRVTEFQPSTTPGYDWIMRDRRKLWQDQTHAQLLARCPYGVPGDRLYVKEKWRPVMEGWRSYVEYAAGGSMEVNGRDLFTGLKKIALRFNGARKDVSSEDWHPSIHMPRWASRITLELTDVRVQRVQDISEEDAMAEGVEQVNGHPERGAFWGAGPSYREGFAQTWMDIYGEDAMRLNPWAWDLTFRVLQ